jgi:hypothetical protein
MTERESFYPYYPAHADHLFANVLLLDEHLLLAGSKVPDTTESPSFVTFRLTVIPVSS